MLFNENWFSVIGLGNCIKRLNLCYLYYYSKKKMINLFLE